MEEGEGDILSEIANENDVTKGGDVTKERKAKCDQNSWFSIIFMTLYFFFFW